MLNWKEEPGKSKLWALCSSDKVKVVRIFYMDSYLKININLTGWPPLCLSILTLFILTSDFMTGFLRGGVKLCPPPLFLFYLSNKSAKNKIAQNATNYTFWKALDAEFKCAIIFARKVRKFELPSSNTFRVFAKKTRQIDPSPSG